jgi:hypothetical protein
MDFMIFSFNLYLSTTFNHLQNNIEKLKKAEISNIDLQTDPMQGYEDKFMKNLDTTTGGLYKPS